MFCRIYYCIEFVANNKSLFSITEKTLNVLEYYLYKSNLEDQNVVDIVLKREIMAIILRYSSFYRKTLDLRLMDEILLQALSGLYRYQFCAYFMLYILYL